MIFESNGRKQGYDNKVPLLSYPCFLPFYTTITFKYHQLSLIENVFYLLVFSFLYVFRCTIDQLDTQTEKKQASQCSRYRADPEKEQAAKRQRYWQSPECARLAKRVKVTQRYAVPIHIHVATYCNYICT